MPQGRGLRSGPPCGPAWSGLSRATPPTSRLEPAFSILQKTTSACRCSFSKHASLRLQKTTSACRCSFFKAHFFKIAKNRILFKARFFSIAKNHIGRPMQFLQSTSASIGQPMTRGGTACACKRRDCSSKCRPAPWPVQWDNLPTPRYSSWLRESSLLACWRRSAEWWWTMPSTRTSHTPRTSISLTLCH